MPCKVSLAPRAARPSAPPAPLPGTPPWQDGAVQTQVEDPSCFALGWVQSPSLALTVQRGRVSLWDTSLMITSVVCCSGHDALGSCLGVSQQVLSSEPFGITPEKAALGQGTLGPLMHWGKCEALQRSSSLLRMAGALQGSPDCPTWPLSIPVFLCSIPPVWWAAPRKDVPAHSWNDSVSPHWHFRALTQWCSSSEAPLNPQWENSSLRYRKLLHGVFAELYVFIRKLLSAVINASRALIFCTSGGKTVAGNRLPVWRFLPWVLQQQMV